MKTVVVSASATARRFNDAFVDYAQARGLFVDPAHVRKPRDKARVENQVAYVRESWFQGETFTSFDHARRSALAWCRDCCEERRAHGPRRGKGKGKFWAQDGSTLQRVLRLPAATAWWSPTKRRPCLER